MVVDAKTAEERRAVEGVVRLVGVVVVSLRVHDLRRLEDMRPAAAAVGGKVTGHDGPEDVPGSPCRRAGDAGVDLRKVVGVARVELDGIDDRAVRDVQAAEKTSPAR
jgi:hypothetical protein